MLSNTCKIAIKAVIYLAAQSEKNVRSGMREIATHLNASEHTVGKILQTLVRQNIIHSVKGPNGGFYITAEQASKPIVHIINTVDGADMLDKCGLGLSQCSSTRPCPIHDEYKKGREIIRQIFITKTINDLRDPVEQGTAYLKY